MGAKYTPRHIANYFLDEAEKENVGITPMKLLKLVYIAYGWNSALTDEPLFDEPIYAWQHGPVIESLYHEFKHFGKNYIDGRSVKFDLDTEDDEENKLIISRIKNDEKTETILEYVWYIYKNFSAWALRDKTHESDSPWSSVYQRGISDIVIPPETIEAYFSDRIKKYLEAA